MADAPPGYQSSSMIPAAGGIIHAIRGGGIPPPGYNPDSLISLTHTTPPIVGFEGGGGETAAEIAAAAAAVSTSTAAATVTPVADSAEPFDDDLAKKIAIAAVVSSPATVVTPVIDAATATDATVVTAATTDAPATKEINLNGRRLTIGAPGTWDATMNNASTPEYEALKWFGVHKTKRNDLKKEILQALYDGICDTNKPLIMALECEPLRRIIQSLAEIQMGNLMAPMRMMSAKAASTDMSDAILMTYNVYQHLCQANKAADYINRSNVDIICTQEDTDGSKLNNYTEVKSCGGGSETERVYMKNNIATNDECISVPGIEIDSVRTPTRSAVLFTVQGVKIANVHLEGGQVTDKKIFTNTAALQAKKLELLEKVLEKQPHIIVGDFNSVYHSIPNVKERFLNIQYDYFSKTVLNKVLTDAEKTIITNWNDAPYDLLLKSGYTYAKPGNEDQFTNENTIVDTIWYKEDKDLFELKDTKIDTIMKTGDTYDTPAGCEYSDHNPVLTTIVFKNTAAEADAAAKVAADAASDGAAKKMAKGLTPLATGVIRPLYPSADPPGVPVATPPTASLSGASATTVEETGVEETGVAATAALLAAAPSPGGNTAAIAAFPPGSAAAVQTTSNELLAQALNMAKYTSVDETKENELAKQIAVAAVATISASTPATSISTAYTPATAASAASAAPTIKKVHDLSPIREKYTPAANNEFVKTILESQAIDAYRPGVPASLPGVPASRSSVHVSPATITSINGVPLATTSPSKSPAPPPPPASRIQRRTPNVTAQLSEQDKIKLSVGTQKQKIENYIGQITFNIKSLPQSELSDPLETKRKNLVKYLTELDNIVASNQAFNKKEANILRIEEAAKKNMTELKGGKRRSKKRRTQKKKRHNKRSTQRK